MFEVEAMTNMIVISIIIKNLPVTIIKFMRDGFEWFMLSQNITIFEDYKLERTGDK